MHRRVALGKNYIVLRVPTIAFHLNVVATNLRRSELSYLLHATIHMLVPFHLETMLQPVVHMCT